ncbi:MAG: lipid-A-disaccharide synthase [Planctomycetota bacterium]|jgi:lipid-A-disaccharide synthase
MKDRPTIFFTAAETSGDHHAAGLVAALRKRLPDARMLGAGGQAMADAGCEIVMETVSKAQMLGGPLLKIPHWIRRVRKLQRLIREVRPDVVVPVDSPALNWHMAKAAKSIHAPVMYYVAPQVWAWARGRVKKLARLTDRVACILPFEEDYLRQRGVNATFVGHPLFDEVPPRPEPMPDLDEAVATGRFRVALLPGSRDAEIANHAAAMQAVAVDIRNHWPEAQCTFAAPDQRAADRIREAVGEGVFEIKVDATPEVLANSHVAVVASGTATLLTAYYGVSMVVVYKVNWLTYQLVGRWIIKTPFLSLVNILAGREVAPELMPWTGGVKNLSKTTLDLMADRERLHTMRQELLGISAPLERRDLDAAGRAADLVIDLIGRGAAS